MCLWLCQSWLASGWISLFHWPWSYPRGSSARLCSGIIIMQFLKVITDSVVWNGVPLCMLLNDKPSKEWHVIEINEYLRIQMIIRDFCLFRVYVTFTFKAIWSSVMVWWINYFAKASGQCSFEPYKRRFDRQKHHRLKSLIQLKVLMTVKLMSD